MTLPQLISVSPSPIPSVPCWVIVCYDFDSTGASSPVSISISFPGLPDNDKAELSKTAPCVPVYVPAGANRVAVVDNSAQSEDGGALVEPD